MKIEICRVSRSNPDPLAEEVIYDRKVDWAPDIDPAVFRGIYSGWYEVGTNHREEILPSGRVRYLKEVPEHAWVIDIPSIEWALERWGTLVLTRSEIPDISLCLEIYDDYRE